MRSLHEQHILILGLGSSGLAMARWCARCGAHITVADTRAAPPQLAALQHAVPSARFISGAFSAELLQDGVDAVFISPGLRPVDTRPILEAARSRHLRTGGELDLFVHALEGLRQERNYTPHILAITGTNGKTTVTSLTGQLLQRAGQTVAVAGNIGPTLLDTLGERLDTNALPQTWVLELSSFQLHGCTVLEPTAATVLNITQDHLDWHDSMDDYAHAKAHVFGNKGVAILNRDDPAVMALLPQTEAAAVPAAGKKTAQSAKVFARRRISFGCGIPQRAGDFGLETVNGMTWLVRAIEDETHIRPRKDASASPAMQLQRLMPADALRIRGRHNACNALAALALASETGAALAPMLYGLREYRGEAHRVEPVGVINGVEYFDDSKGTNVGATVAALTGLGADRRIVLILGGEGKGQDFSPLATPVARYARAVVLIGRDAPQIRSALSDTGVALIDAPDLPQAVALATQRAHAGDAVLMSPACASFDMFKDYEHRAHVFCDTVRSLAQDAGQTLEGE